MPKEEDIPTFRNPSLATDIIIEHERGGRKGIVLVERRNPPHGLALPGGFHEFGLSCAENARKEAKEETNLDIILLDHEDHPFMVRSGHWRDPRYHIVSVIYRATGHGTLRGGDDAKEAFVYTVPQVRYLIDGNKLAFDHAHILSVYLQAKGGSR